MLYRFFHRFDGDCMKNILVVDDNTEIIEAVSQRLPRYLKDCRVFTATDGVQGEAVMRSNPIDLVLTDLSMPAMNGYLLIERTKKNHPSVPICVMTAGCTSKVIDRLLSLGVGRWIQKPFKFEKLAQMIAGESGLKTND